MPVDAEPVDAGNIALRRENGLTIAAVTAPAPGQYRSHFQTCPHAGQWRSR